MGSTKKDEYSELKTLVESLDIQVKLLVESVKSVDSKISRVQGSLISSKDCSDRIEKNLELIDFDLKVISFDLGILQSTVSKVYWVSIVSLGGILGTLLFGLTSYLRYM